MSSGDDRQANRGLGPVPATGGTSPVRASSTEVFRKQFLDFYDAEYHEVVRFVMRDGATLHDAQDAAHEAFFQAYRKVQTGQWQHLADPRAWTRKVALNHYRAQRRFMVPIDPVPEAPEQGLGHAELTGQALDLVTAPCGCWIPTPVRCWLSTWMTFLRLPSPPNSASPSNGPVTC